VNVDAAVRKFNLTLVAADPRVYRQALQVQALILAAAYTPLTLTNYGTVPGPVQVDIAMSGAGSSTFTITRAGVSMVVDLSGLSNGETVRIYMETCGPYGRGKRLVLNGVTDAFPRKVSGPDTWLDMPVGDTAWTLTNRTNISSVFVTWYDAWA
jgi:hypothetical protein